MVVEQEVSLPVLRTSPGNHNRAGEVEVELKV